MDRTDAVRLRAPLMALTACVIAHGAWAGVVESPLTVDGRIRDVEVLDVDGDGMRDLLIVSASGQGRDATRSVSIFRQSTPKTFRERPDATWILDREVVALDPFGNRYGDDTAALYTLRADGVYRHVYRASPPRMDSSHVLEVSLPHLIPAEESVAVLDFSRDWTGAGPDLLVPDFPRPTLHRATPDGYAAALALDVPPVSFYSVLRGEKELRGAAVVAYYTFPMPEVSDPNGDGRPEISFVERDRVTVFAPGSPAVEDGAGVLEGRTYPVRILSDEEAATDRFAVRTRLVDLEGDGRADLVAVVFRDAGVLEFEGRVMVFRGRENGSLPPEADEVIRVDDALYSLAQVIDLDGDGAMEIILPSARLGLWGYLRLLTTRKASFAFNSVESREGRFETDEIDRDSMAARLSRRFDLPVIKLVDMSGDGIVDLVIGSGEDRVCVHDGTDRRQGRRFRSKARLCYEADPYARYVISDLDGDGRAELMRHGTGDENRGRLVIAFLDE